MNSPTRKNPEGLRIAFIGARGIGSMYSGIETYYEEVGHRLVARGHELLAYCRRHATPDDLDPRGIEPIFQPCVRSKHGETFSHTLFSSFDVLRRNVDLVQLHALGPSLFAPIPRSFGIPTVASIRGLDWQREKWGRVATGFLKACENLSHRLPDATSVVSRTLADHYRAAHGAEVRCIPNGVNPVEAPEPREIRALGLEGRDYLLYMGRLSPEKGLDVLLRAFAPLAKRKKLVLAGGSSYTDSYLEELKRMAPENVLFTGRVDGRLRDELYGNSYAFLLPSTMEGLSVALLEAMAFGSCVLTSDIPENRELVDGIGHTFRVGDAASLQQALEELLANPQAARAAGEAAQRHVRQHYSWDEITRQTEEFYFDVLDRGPRQHGARDAA